jgi:hypothetical protein
VQAKPFPPSPARSPARMRNQLLHKEFGKVLVDFLGVLLPADEEHRCAYRRLSSGMLADDDVC